VSLLTHTLAVGQTDCSPALPGAIGLTQSTRAFPGHRPRRCPGNIAPHRTLEDARSAAFSGTCAGGLFDSLYSLVPNVFEFPLCPFQLSLGVIDLLSGLRFHILDRIMHEAGNTSED
jgi:hypothetical protein